MRSRRGGRVCQGRFCSRKSLRTGSQIQHKRKLGDTQIMHNLRKQHAPQSCTTHKPDACTPHPKCEKRRGKRSQARLPHSTSRGNKTKQQDLPVNVRRVKL
ncbi:hypothetical protein M758_10G074800 [Ceratodon purpureus]|nr:hypothetical protein M758_10G074800 [Ceratodon purpureus]